MSGTKFLKKWQVRDIISEWIVFQFTFNLLWMTQTQEIITCRIWKFTNGYGGGMCMNRGKFLNEWQVTDKIIEWIVFQFIFNLLQMTQTQEIINCRVSKIHKWIWVAVYEWGNVFKEWQVRDKIIEWIFFQFVFNILQMTQTQRNNQLLGFENSQMDMRGCVWVGESF